MPPIWYTSSLTSTPVWVSSSKAAGCWPPLTATYRECRASLPTTTAILILRRWFSSRGSFPSGVFTFGKGRQLWLSQWDEGWGEAALRAPTQRTEARAGMRLNTPPRTEQPHRRAEPGPTRQQCCSRGAPFYVLCLLSLPSVFQVFSWQ